MLTKIISGGQTGADTGGLIAAKLHGLNTGGWMPKGFRTLVGPRPQYAKLFGIKEHEAYGYKERTWENIKDSDATIRVARNFDSAGERCTLNGIRYHGRPYFDIHVDEDEIIFESHVGKLANWLEVGEYKTINIAGNSHSTWSNARPYTTAFLSYVLMVLGYNRQLVLPKEFNIFL